MNPWTMFTNFIAIFALMFANFGAFAKQEEKTIFIAHRGFCSQYLENTEEAFIEAAKAGFGGCETDVNISKDGVLMLVHGSDYYYEDGTVMNVNEYTYDELTSKPLKNDFTDTVLYPCTFERYIEIMAEYHLFAFIELKGEYPDEALDEVVGTVERLYTWDMCSIQSMQMPNLVALREKYPDIPLMYCGGGYTKEVEEAIDRGFDLDLLVYDSFPWILKKAQNKGLRVALWTADDRKAVAYCLMLGVDFIESDYLSGLNMGKES
ncbi:MAG: hypothetical protein IJK23_14610 [Clostridia bacterium]|nr:hypothetical protein [Clostridia bacterium]